MWDFKPYGQCGKLLGDVVAPLGTCVDDIAFIHNVVGKIGVLEGNAGDLRTGLPWQSVHVAATLLPPLRALP